VKTAQDERAKQKSLHDMAVEKISKMDYGT